MREAEAEKWALIIRAAVVATIVEAGSLGARVVGHLLRDFEFAAVPQILRDSCHPKGVATDLCLDARRRRRGGRSCGRPALTITTPEFRPRGRTVDACF
jgi:hypothetical protein